MVKNYPSKYSKEKDFSGPLAMGLLNSIPYAKTPVEAILLHVDMLVIESGMTKPPFTPETYAPLRRVKEVVHKNMEVDGRLIPCSDGFIIELNKKCSLARRNFTFAHELAHTFFYESVPSIKYRSQGINHLAHDEEEERLCNIAAAELLMPRSVFSSIVKQFLPSPEALQELAHIFGTSLTSTVIRLLNLKLWDTPFILWKYKEKQLQAEWIASPLTNLRYSPKLELMDVKMSGVYHTFITGKTTSKLEWFNIEKNYKLSRFRSKRINSDTVLSCLTNQTRSENENSETPISLPLRSDCECNGVGWRYINVDGRSRVTRCLAAKHKKA